jgi:LL-diaminopimelate aminotransferase
LEENQACVENINKVYTERRDILVDGLIELGLSVEKPRATFYVWIEAPKGYNSAEFTSHLLSNGGIVVTPGNGFGKAGEGYVRMALTVDKERIKEAVERIKSIGF